jgi:hypothetical protein
MRDLPSTMRCDLCGVTSLNEAKSLRASRLAELRPPISPSLLNFEFFSVTSPIALPTWSTMIAAIAFRRFRFLSACPKRWPNKCPDFSSRTGLRSTPACPFNWSSLIALRPKKPKDVVEWCLCPFLACGGFLAGAGWAFDKRSRALSPSWFSANRSARALRWKLIATNRRKVFSTSRIRPAEKSAYYLMISEQFSL